jgi:hypothetical protein
MLFCEKSWFYMHLKQPIKLPFLEFIGWQTADVYQLYSDPSVHARDLIDLAFLRNQQPIPALAIDLDLQKISRTLSESGDEIFPFLDREI